MKHYLHTALLLALFCVTSCNAQNPEPHARPKLIKTHNTGPYDNVGCSMLDKAGNLWFGTSGEGIYRYVGDSFINYTTKNGLISNKVSSIVEDKEGNIWIGTDLGLCRYAPSATNNTFKCTPISLTNENDYSSLLGHTPTPNQKKIWSMMMDKSGRIWVGTYDDGVYCYSPSTKAFTHFLHNDGVVNKNNLHLSPVSAMAEDKNGNIWFTTWFEGICRYDGKSVTNYKPNGEVWYAHILEDSHGNIWFGRRDKGVCRYETSTATFTNVLQHGIFDSCGVDEMVEDNKGSIWFGTEYGDMVGRETMGGVWRYNPTLSGTNAFTNFTTKDGLHNMSVFSAIKDKSGTLWFGTRDMGLNSYDPSATPQSGTKPFIDYSDTTAHQN